MEFLCWHARNELYNQYFIQWSRGYRLKHVSCITGESYNPTNYIPASYSVVQFTHVTFIFTMERLHYVLDSSELAQSVTKAGVFVLMEMLETGDHSDWLPSVLHQSTAWTMFFQLLCKYHTMFLHLEIAAIKC